MVLARDKHPTGRIWQRCHGGAVQCSGNAPFSPKQHRRCVRADYVRLERGFAYLVAVIDWYSRRVLSWRISNSRDAAFCVDCVEDALREHGKPEVFNSDQGSQFTSDVFTGVLKRRSEE